MQPALRFAVLADPTRCRVVELLHERRPPVHELAGAFAIGRPAISRHLRVHKDASLVREEKRGREYAYSLQRRPLRLLTAWHRHWNCTRASTLGLSAAKGRPSS